MERVSVINGKVPIIVVAPHGYDQDDQNTALIAETIAGQIDCYAVINRGWERSDTVDYLKDKADCNNAYHCREDVVREEFLDPLIRFKNRIVKDFNKAFIFYIHGMANKHRKICGDPNLDIVVGYGAGSPNSFTCEQFQKDFLILNLNQAGLKTYQGKKGGPMSGWSRNNMNQYFRKWENDPYVSSVQLEIIYDLRNEKDIASLTADYLGGVFLSTSKCRSFNGTPNWLTY